MNGWHCSCCSDSFLAARPGRRSLAGATPEAEGLDRPVLEAFDSELAAGKHGYVDSMLVIRHGKVVYEKTYDHSKDYARLFDGKGAPGIYNYYDPGWHPYYKGTRLHTMQSVSKSVTSALIGIAIGRGEIPGVDVKVMPYFSALRHRAGSAARSHDACATC